VGWPPSAPSAKTLTPWSYVEWVEVSPKPWTGPCGLAAGRRGSAGVDRIVGHHQRCQPRKGVASAPWRVHPLPEGTGGTSDRRPRFPLPGGGGFCSRTSLSRAVTCCMLSERFARSPALSEISSRTAINAGLTALFLCDAMWIAQPTCGPAGQDRAAASESGSRG